MRFAVVEFAVSGREGALVLDLGSGPGTMARVVRRVGGEPVLLDASMKMLRSAQGDNRVQAVFEHLPFRDGCFSSMVAGFSLRDSADLVSAIAEIRRVGAPDSRFAFCDLGRSDSFIEAVILGVYLRVATPLIGAVAGGRSGLGFGSLFDTYVLTLPNGMLKRLLSRYFSTVDIEAKRLGGSVVARCSA